jgi:hypothetical protein
LGLFEQKSEQREQKQAASVPGQRGADWPTVEVLLVPIAAAN